MSRITRRLARSFAPDLIVDRVTLITPEYLKDCNITGLILDLDNTLTPWQSEIIPDDILTWLDQMRHSGVQLCIASNTHNRRRLDRVAKALGMHYIQGIPKPRKLCFSKAFDHFGLGPDKVAVIGDQMFTDIWGGKRSGIHTIMVLPIHPREFIGTKLSRLFESQLLKLFRRRQLLREKV